MHTILTSRRKRQTIAVNNQIKPILLIVFAALFSGAVKAQDSCALQVSLITCAPGNELYSIFGHSALRIKDYTVGTDIVYNYGTFEFDDPDFYSKFVRGKLLYFLSQNYYADFIYSYAQEGRAVAEQTLQLSCEQKRKLQQFIFKNMQEENRFYKYDFLFDNCTTRLRDIIQDSSQTLGIIPQATNKTFRDGLHDYLDRGHMHWSKLGIDLLLGTPADKKMSNSEAMFLPEYLETAVDHTPTIVSQKTYPVPAVKTIAIEDSYLTRPIFIFSILCCVVLLLSFSKNNSIQHVLRFVDTLYFSSIGILGCIFLFMWLGSDHQQMRNNLNILWAWPTHLLWIFIHRNTSLQKPYQILYASVSILVLILWCLLPQQMNVALIPLLIMGTFRCWINVFRNERTPLHTKDHSA